MWVGTGFTVSGGGLMCRCWFQSFGLVMFGAPGPPFRRTDRPKISLFFPLSRLKIPSFCFSLGAFSWNFGGVLKAGKLKCARLGLVV